MRNRTKFQESIQKRRAVSDAEARGQIADSMDVRNALMRRVCAGEITLEQAQAELESIKRRAKIAGKVTREQAFKAG